MGQLEDAVADAVLEKFEPLPRNSKPDEDGKGIRNWVPLSGIVLALGTLKSSISSLSSRLMIFAYSRQRKAGLRSTGVSKFNVDSSNLSK